MEAPYGFLESLPQGIPDDVAAFCERRKLHVPLQEALRLARECFQLVEEPQLSLEYDPDNPEDEWICAQIAVKGEVEEILAADRVYVRQWARTIPWPECFLIRLSLDVR